MKPRTPTAARTGALPCRYILSGGPFGSERSLAASSAYPRSRSPASARTCLVGSIRAPQSQPPTCCHWAISRRSPAWTRSSCRVSACALRSSCTTVPSRRTTEPSSSQKTRVPLAWTRISNTRWKPRISPPSVSCQRRTKPRKNSRQSIIQHCPRSAGTHLGSGRNGISGASHSGSDAHLPPLRTTGRGQEHRSTSNGTRGQPRSVIAVRILVGWESWAGALRPCSFRAGRDMSEGPLVTCIMPTRDRRAFLPRAVELYLAQDYEPRELVVLDDGDDCVRDCFPDDPRVRYLRGERGLSVGAKRNALCEAARGEIVAHWDDDDWYPAWRLRRQVEAMAEPQVLVSGT